MADLVRRYDFVQYLQSLRRVAFAAGSDAFEEGCLRQTGKQKGDKKKRTFPHRPP